MPCPDRPLSSDLDFSDMDPAEVDAFFAAIMNVDRTLIGIPPDEVNPYTYSHGNLASSTDFPSSSQHSHSAPPDDPGDFHGESLMVHQSYVSRSASSHPASHASRSTIPQITFNEPEASTPQLMLFIPNPGLAGQEPPLSPGNLDALARSSGHDFLSPVSTPSNEYSSSEGTDWDIFDNESFDGPNEQDQAYTYGEKYQEQPALQALGGQEPLSPLVCRPRQLPVYEAPDDQDSMNTDADGSQLSPDLPERSYIPNMDLGMSTFATQQVGSRVHDDMHSRSDVNKRKRKTAEQRKELKRMRELKACIRCQVLRIKVSCGTLYEVHNSYLTQHQQCSGGDSCRACQIIQGTAKIWKMRCFHARLSDVGVYRTGKSTSAFQSSILI